MYIYKRMGVLGKIWQVCYGYPWGMFGVCLGNGKIDAALKYRKRDKEADGQKRQRSAGWVLLCSNKESVIANAGKRQRVSRAGPPLSDRRRYTIRR